MQDSAVQRVPSESHATRATAGNVAWGTPPRYLLRLSLLRRVLRKVKPQRVLEVGCAAGHLLGVLASLGCDAHGIEISTNAFELLKQRFGDSTNPTFEIGDFHRLQDTFDAVLAFEVLEHIEDDDAAVRKWKELLNPGGHLIISVPAHRRRWTAADDAAGHVRRYERDELRELLTRNGLIPLQIDCYGFPLANLVAPLNERAHRHLLSLNGPQERTAQSGVSRSMAHRLRPLCNPVTMWPWCQFQRLFLNTDLGNGFFIVAQRPPVDLPKNQTGARA
jgi:SAM-dependent methyltransferase